MTKFQSLTAIVKPTHECNLACKYCYVEEEAERDKMDSKTLRNTIEQLSQLPEVERIRIIWHGGEPLLMGLEFYEEALAIQKATRKNIRFENSMQSNATLVNEAIINFCEKNAFNIGSSLDGPGVINDFTRVYPNGKGSFQDAFKGIKLLQERTRHKRQEKFSEEKKCTSVGTGVIVILTKKNINKLEEIYRFFKAEGISIKVNPLIRSGNARVNYDQLSIGSKEYGEALTKLFDMWFYSQERISIDPLEEILGNLMTNYPRSCNFSLTCRHNFISVGPKGDVYPCGRFDGVREFRLGNINEDNLTSLLDSSRHKDLAERNARTVKGCSLCEYKEICNSGCMHNAYMVKGDINDKDYYCGSYKILFKHLEKALIEELKKVEVKT